MLNKLRKVMENKNKLRDGKTFRQCGTTGIFKEFCVRLRAEEPVEFLTKFFEMG